MDETDYRILKELQEGLPLVREPFRELAHLLGLTEPEVLERLRVLRVRGVIRKFRARIDQRRAGFTANALVAWCVPPERKDAASGILSEAPGVTHCYERRPVPGRWRYSLYTVHHGKNRDMVIAEVSALALMTGVSDYLVLFSTEEFKRTAVVRIGENGGIPA